MGELDSIRQNPHMYNSEERKNTPNDERVMIAQKAMTAYS